MLAPPLRITAFLIILSTIAVTEVSAEKRSPPKRLSTKRLQSVPITPSRNIDLAAATKPQAIEEPRVFSSGPVLSPVPPLPMSIPEAPLVDSTGGPPLPTIQPGMRSQPPRSKIHAPQRLAAPPAPMRASPPEHASPPAPNAVLPTLEQYYQPYSNPVAYSPASPPMDRDWASLDALVWWTSKSDIPVLASTSPATTPINQAGVLGPNTSPYFGGDDIFGQATAGFRLRAGHYFNDCDGSGISGEFLMLGSRGHDFHASSAGNDIIARPFYNTQLNAPDSQLVSYPGQYRGSLDINAETRMYSFAGHLWGELYVDRCCHNCCDGCGDGASCGNGCGTQSSCQSRRSGETELAIKIGPRFSHLDDTMLINENTVRATSGGSFRLLDSFKTENSFLGAEVGIRARRERGPLDLELGLQLALGATRQELDIRGSQTHTTAGGVQTKTPGGFLALDSNSGSWDRDRFSLIPALEFELGYELNSGWRAVVGYNLMYWTNVLRASEQIDSTINTDKLQPIQPGTGPERPSVPFNESDYLAHGISFGLERRW